MINEIKNNYLELRQEDVNDLTEQDAIEACNRLARIMSDKSEYDISWDSKHYAPSIDNSYIGDFEELNKFNEEISGRGLFFPNTIFKSKNNNVEVNGLYLVNTINGVYMIIDEVKTYEFRGGAVKHLNYTLKAEKLVEALFYTTEENKVIECQNKKIIKCQEYLNILASLEGHKKKDGSEFKDWGKSYTVKYHGAIFPVTFNIDYTYINNEPYAAEIIIIDKTIYLTSDNLDNNFSRENIIKQFLKAVERKKNECLHEIDHAKGIIINVKQLVAEYNKIQEKIDALRNSLNKDLKYILN